MAKEPKDAQQAGQPKPSGEHKKDAAPKKEAKPESKPGKQAKGADAAKEAAKPEGGKSAKPGDCRLSSCYMPAGSHLCQSLPVLQ